MEKELLLIHAGQRSTYSLVLAGAGGMTIACVSPPRVNRAEPWCKGGRMPTSETI